MGELLASTLGAVLIVSALLKTANGARMPLLEWSGLGPSVARVVEVLNRVVEIVIGGALFVGIDSRLLYVCAMALFATYLGVLSYASIRGFAAPCRCFGGLDRHPVGVVEIGRGVALVVASIILVRMPIVEDGAGSFFPQLFGLLGATTIIGSAALLREVSGIFDGLKVNA